MPKTVDQLPRDVRVAPKVGMVQQPSSSLFNFNQQGMPYMNDNSLPGAMSQTWGQQDNYWGNEQEGPLEPTSNENPEAQWLNQNQGLMLQGLKLGQMRKALPATMLEKARKESMASLGIQEGSEEEILFNMAFEAGQKLGKGATKLMDKAKSLFDF